MRHYIFPADEEPMRLSQRLINGLVHGRDALPQYSGTSQHVLSASLEMEGNKPVRIVGTTGEIWKFDLDGRIHKSLAEAASLGIASMDLGLDDTVVDLEARQKRQKRDREFRWTPGKEEIDRIIADIWPKKAGDHLKFAQGTSRKKAPLTHDARHCMEEITGKFWKFEYEISQLKEPSLKGFIHEARARANDDFPETPELYNALAEIAERSLEIQRRKRRGTGVWYALVEVLFWTDGMSTTAAQYYERCKGRKAAIKAARKLLAEHALNFSEDTTIEAEILTDLEWERRALLHPEET